MLLPIPILIAIDFAVPVSRAPEVRDFVVRDSVVRDFVVRGPVVRAPVVRAPVVRAPVVRGSVVQQSIEATITRAQSAWTKVKTLRATFEQTITNPITGSALTSRGQLQQRKPNKLAITFLDPAGDRIVADGKHVWIFLQSTTPGQVVRMANTDVGAASTDLIGQFLSTPRSKYDAADAGWDKVGSRRARILVLTAKAGELLPFIRAKVWVDSTDSLIRQFEATDGNGVARKVRILTLSPNASVEGAAFTFAVPKGVRVVER